MKTLFVCVCAAVLGAAFCFELDEDGWEAWKRKYNKFYPSGDEEEARKMAWLENADFVAAHNVRSDVTYQLELNQFADELSVTTGDPDVIEKRQEFPKDETIPKQFDWRTKHVIGPVKDQGMIGAVEAFVAAECVESFHAIKTGTLYNLSVVEVWDCCREEFELPVTDDVFGCVHNIGGLCTAKSYPNVARCANGSCEAVAQVEGTKHIPHNNEVALLYTVLKVPVFVTINASPQSFQMYKSGIYSDPQCTGEGLDHVLQLIGYGEDDKGNKFWICKNSWGVNWGMEGYIYMQRGVNRCGIAEDAKYPY